MSPDAKPAHPGVRFPPPTLFIGGFGIAWLLEIYFSRIRIVSTRGNTAILEILGVTLWGLGIILMVWGLVTFAMARTAILPMRPASRIVDHGPYRFTRNPMYVGMSLAYIGGAFVLNSVWALIFFPVVIAVLTRLVIAREERYLSSAFGEEYHDYRRRVRRWI